MAILKKISTLIICTCIITSTYACDVCGCGSGGVFLGMMPSYKKYFVGLRYQYRTYQSHLGSATGLYRTSEKFLTAEWFGGVRINNRIQLMAFVPYQWHTQESVLEKAAINGFGDVSVMGTYKVLEHVSLKGEKTLHVHTLQVGGGIKLPTGKWRFDEGDNLGQHANFMPGTGSLDWMGIGLYQYSAGNLGISASAMYRLTSTNANGYKFGNRSQIAAQSFYQIMLKGKARITPNAGLMFEVMEQDKAEGRLLSTSGGRLLNGLLGLEFSKGTVAGGMVIQPPLWQQLSGGEVENQGRGLLYITVVL